MLCAATVLAYLYRIWLEVKILQCNAWVVRSNNTHDGRWKDRHGNKERLLNGTRLEHGEHVLMLGTEGRWRLQ